MFFHTYDTKGVDYVYDNIVTNMDNLPCVTINHLADAIFICPE